MTPSPIPSSVISTPATTTSAGNGITTPTPTQPNIVSNCDKFHLVETGQTCEVIAGLYGISQDELKAWNPNAGSSCTGLWADAYACVSIIGHESAPTTTSPGNGIATPTPTQGSIVNNCDAFHFVEVGQTCEVIAGLYGITQDEFKAWNPSVGSACTGLWANAYACVSTIGHAPSPTTTTPGNGISTPTPTQATIVNNCDAFYFVVAGDTCETITAKHGITQAQFLAWNPSVGSTCSGLWANAYACVSIIGHTPSIPTTTTTTGNGIATPTPVQPNMVSNCDSFHKVQSGDTCATIAAAKGISVSQFTTWNPYVRSDCSLLWLDYYVCVSIVGHTPTPVNPGNGIQTPTPYQDGMTTSCKTFHFVQSGQNCDYITGRYGITRANFVKWNPAVRSDCTGMWANAYVCVAVL